MKRIYGDTTARLLTYIIKDETTGCWIWQRSKQPSGYGQINIDGKIVLAHRAMYELLVGPISSDKELDHLCRVRSCVNPEHLESVDPIENWRRGESPTRINALKTNCIRGHSLDDAYVGPKGGRTCRTCCLLSAEKKADHVIHKRPNRRRNKLTPKSVALIKQQLSDGETPLTVAQRYEVSRSMIYKIRNGNNWTQILPGEK